MAHPLISGMEERLYQSRIAYTALKKNTLVCLPTGLGKTNIAILVAAGRLRKFPESRIMVLAPTKPLVSQHFKSFQKFLNLDPPKFQTITGMISASKRSYSGQVIFATPQTVQKDLESGRLNLRDFSLLVIDEIHHAVGKYSYPLISRTYLQEASNPRILGLTASPGSNREKIREICRNTGIEAFEIATEKDEDVQPYVQETQVEWIEAFLPESFLKIKTLLDSAFKRRVKNLRGVRTKKDLLILQRKFQQSIQSGNKAAYGLSSLVAQAIKIEHALTLLETQGIGMLWNYMKSLESDSSKAASSILNDQDFSNAIFLTESLFRQGSRHPKISLLCSVVERQLRKDPHSRIIIFANFRETVREIHQVISRLPGSIPIVLTGQKDLSQKEQGEIIGKFGNEANILVTTSIGEEGLSLEAADVAVFYEPVPSEIRQIQRRGRVGRTKFGRIIVLVTKNTRDETYRWAAYRKEKEMRNVLHTMKNSLTRF